VPGIHPEITPRLSYIASGAGSSNAKRSEVNHRGTLSIWWIMLMLYRTVGIRMYDLPNINLTNIIEGASMSVSVLRVLEHRHCWWLSQSEKITTHVQWTC
jgi:hypothetical protein